MNRDMRLVLRIDADGKAAIEGIRSVGREANGLGNSFEQGAARAEGGFGKIRREAQETNTVLAGVRNQMAGFAAALLSVQGLRTLATLADQYRNISTQIGLITRNEEELANVRARAFEISQRTFVNFDTTASLVARLSRATSELTEDAQLAQTTALGLAETIQQTFAISGAGQQEASNAIRQLAQGLAAGVLRGDEFNSVMEQAPRLAQALANSLGVTTGQLRAQAEQGKLTSATIVNALIEQREAIDREFATVPVTIERAMGNARGSILRVVGELDEQLGASGGIAQGIQGIGELIGRIPAVFTLWATEIGRVQQVMDGLSAETNSQFQNILASAQTIKTEVLNGLQELLILPVSLRTAFTIIIAEGDVLLTRFGVLTQELAAAFERAWILVRETGATAFGLIQIRFGELIDELLGDLSSFAKRSADVLGSVPGMSERAEALRQIGAGLANAATLEEQYRAKLEATQRTYDADRAAIDTRLAQGRERAAQLEAIARGIALEETAERQAALARLDGAAATAAQGAALRKLGLDGRTGAGGLKQTAEAAKESRDALTRLADLSAQWSGELTGGLSRALTQHSARLRQLAQIEASLARTQSLSAQAQANLTQAREIAAEQLRRAVDAQVASLRGPLAQAELEHTEALREIKTLRDQLIERGMKVAEVEDLIATATANANRERAETARRIWEQQNPYNVLLNSIELEIQMLSLSTRNREAAAIALQLETAARDQGIQKTAEQINMEAQLLAQRLQAARLDNRESQLRESGEALFGLVRREDLNDVFPFRSFGDLLAGAATEGLRRGGQGFLRTFSDGLIEAFSNSPLQAGASALDFLSGFQQERRAGRDTAGSFLTMATNSAANSGIPQAQAAAALVRAIDSLTSGRLLGTTWQRDRSGASIAVGAGGVTGSQSETDVRQRSLFRGRQWRTVTSDLDDGARQQLEAWLDGMREAVQAGARALRVEAPALIEGSFKEVRDAQGRITSQISTVLGRTWSESVEEFQQRLTAENLIAVIDRALGGAARAAGQSIGAQIVEGAGGGLERGGGEIFDGLAKAIGSAQVDVSAIAERWRADASTLLEGAQFLLAAAADIQRGAGLLGDASTLPALADLIEELQQPTESLVETYSRVSGATRLLDQALTLSGVQLDQAREAVVRFAVDIAEAAGGLEQAGALWDRYFEVAFSAEERLQAAIDGATRARDDVFAAAGVAAGTGIAELRASVEQALAAGSSPDRIVNLLRAIDALGRLNELYAEQAAAIGETTAALEEERAAREAALAEARASYARLASDLVRAVAEIGASDLVRELGEVRRAERERIIALNDAARAAGLQAAREEDLARAHLLAADAAARAIARARAAAQSIVDDLYGTPLQQIEAQIAAIQGAGGGGLSGIAAGANEVGDAWGAVIDRIKSSLDEVARGPLGGLRPRDQLAEIQRQFNAAVAAARGGDASAAGRANDLFGELLRVGQRVFASGDAYQRLLAESRAALQSLLGMGGSATGGGPGGTIGAIGGSAGAGNERLAELLRQRDEMLAAQEAQRRRAQAEELAAYIREIAQVTGELPLAILAGMGVPLERFAADLGIQLDDLTVETTGALAALANRLSVELPDLAAGLGVELGALADANSLINDALEAVIRRQPPEIADALAPLLARLEQAVSPEDQLAALAALEQYIDQLAPALRVAFAPFFDGIDPETVDEQIAILSGARDIAAESLVVFQELERIALESLAVSEMIGVDTMVEQRRTTSAVDRAAEAQQAALNAVREATESGLMAVVRAIEESQPVQPVPPEASFAIGTPRVPKDMVASIHAGEAVIDARSMRVLRDYGIRVQAAAGPDSGKAIVDELRALRDERSQADALSRTLADRIERLERAQRDTATAIGRQTDVLRRSHA